MPSLSFITTSAALIATVSAHGYVASITAGGTTYTGANPAFVYQTPAPEIPGWLASNLDNGFVAPDSFSSDDIICHKSASPGQAYVTVAAGEEVRLQWNTWPESHIGPVIDYIASCNGECTDVEKTTLSFVKIDAKAWESGSSPGTWATDDLIADSYSWNVQIPSALEPGNYVLRHEIIALHSAGSEGGAQAYPQCINLKVTGSGSTAISGGESATEFYTSTDPGILFNVYTTFTSYTIPGPDVWSAAASKVRRHVRDFFAGL